MLLLACALGAVVALGAISHSLSAATATNATIAPPARRAEPANVSSAAPIHRFPASPLTLLLATSITDRFPSTVLALTPRPAALVDAQIVSYYGSPYTPALGLLGSGGAEAVADEVERHAALYDRLNGPTRVIPALHLIYAVAQPDPTSNGLYLQYADDEDVERYVELTRERGMLLFLDIQIGRSSVRDEIERVLPFLREPHVHLAIDPEFAVNTSQVPGEHLGSLRSSDIDYAQRVLQGIADDEHLPAKLLIVHQFIDSMLKDGDAIQRYPDVELIVDMDGFGPAEIKRATYEQYAARSYAAHAAIKLFLDYDPDLMSEEDVLALKPRPAIVIYQ